MNPLERIKWASLGEGKNSYCTKGSKPAEKKKIRKEAAETSTGNLRKSINGWGLCKTDVWEFWSAAL